MFKKSLMFSKKYCPRKNLLTEEFIDLNYLRTRPILKASKTISLMNMINKVKWEAILADLKTKVSTQAKDLLFQETRNYPRKAADDL